MASDKQWLAAYTRPRWEKKVFALLDAKGIETYCPLNKVKKQWSDRVKLVEEPLFKSYVFVHVTEEEQAKVRMTNGVVNFIYWLGKPARIKQKEIDRIKRFLNEYEEVEVHQTALQPNDKVIIRSGILMDKEATVKRTLHNKVEVEIESLGCKLVAYVDSKKLIAIKNYK
ncbi:MAG: UpxY family transcription antiterminator [Flavihumibacter sp.]|nr:UpxY family transcription antiterminator [Flavihumibacter sp.]